MKVKIKKVPQANNGIAMLGEGDVRPISSNSYSSPLVEFKGPSHDDGGIPIAFSGKQVEVEGNETAFQDNKGDLQIFGNMKVPGLNKKFKSVSKDIAIAENKAAKIGDKGAALVDKANPYNPHGALTYNSGTVLVDAAKQKQKILSDKKEALANVQNVMLDLAQQHGVEPQEISEMMENGGTIARDGKRIVKKIATEDDLDQGLPTDVNPNEGDDLSAIIQKAAIRNGIDPKIFANLTDTESGNNPSAVSYKGAMGVFQFMPGTAKQYGITPKQLKSDDPKDLAIVADAAAKHLSGLLQANGNDYKLALIGYNGGQGAIQKVRGWMGNPQASGDEIMKYWEDKRSKGASTARNAYHNQTYEYVNSVLTGDKPVRENFRQKYYAPPRVKEDIPYMDTPSIKPTPVTPNTDIPPTKITQQELLDGQPTPIPVTPKPPVTSLADRNKLGVGDFLSEIGYLAQRPDAVPHLRYNPILHTPYQVSFQDRLNENQATFSAIQKQIANNPAALADLAATKYSSDAQVLGEQFRTNQAISNDITNKNVGILNDAELKNLQLTDTQVVRQAQSLSNTRAQKYQALSSIGDKFAKNRAENNNIRMAENMFNYRPDENGVMKYIGPDAQFNTEGGTGLGTPSGKITTTYDGSGNVQNKKITQEDFNKQMDEYYKMLRDRKASQKLSIDKWGGSI